VRLRRLMRQLRLLVHFVHNNVGKNVAVGRSFPTPNVGDAEEAKLNRADTPHDGFVLTSHLSLSVSSSLLNMSGLSSVGDTRVASTLDTRRSTVVELGSRTLKWALEDGQRENVLKRFMDSPTTVEVYVSAVALWGLQASGVNLERSAFDRLDEAGDLVAVSSDGVDRCWLSIDGDPALEASQERRRAVRPGAKRAIV
jgi:hypothetical protein